MPAAAKTSSRNAGFFHPTVELAGTAKSIPTGVNTGNAAGDEVIEVTILLRRKRTIDSFLKTLGKTGKNAGKPLTREQYTVRYGASSEDLKLIHAFARIHNLTVVSSSAAKRSVILKGTVQAFSAAFGVFLSRVQPAAGIAFRGRSGSIRIPEVLDGIITGVFGLDDRPQARPMFQMRQIDRHVIRPSAASVSYNPDAVARAYKYPSGVSGKGQCIALIELGGGYRNEDLSAYFQKLNITLPTVTAQSVGGAHNSPSTPDSADGEVALDIEVAGAVAPGAAIVVYFAPNTDQGFLDAINAALHDSENKPSVISISWGAAESQWTTQALTNFNEAFKTAAGLGVTVTAAAGDNGSSDRETDGKAHCDFPASSPFVVSCGGTKLLGKTETVWNDKDGWATGGGISDVFPVPDYQKHITLPASVNSKTRKGRGMPDVAANADSATGYNVLVDGQWTVVGGTSAVAPLVAALIALINEKRKKNAGYIHPRIYATTSPVFRDITDGDNITATAGGYSAGKGWDACTGLGVPLGSISEIL